MEDEGDEARKELRREQNGRSFDGKDEDNMVEALMGTIQGELRQLPLLLREVLLLDDLADRQRMSAGDRES